MAVAATITISGSTSGDALANQIFNALVTLPASVNQKTAVSVPVANAGASPPVTGATILLPIGTTVIIILPTNPNVATALTLKGLTAGDTGVNISMTLPTVLTIPTTSASTASILLVATAFSVPVELIFL